MRVTIKDIAKQAQVSYSTVATILRGDANRMISQATAERVRRIAEEMAYRPNLAARSLRGKKTCCIGVVVRTIRDNLSPDMVGVVEEYMWEHNYDLSVHLSHRVPEREWRAIDRLIGNRVDGLIVTPTGTKEKESLEYYKTVPIPMVLLEGPDGSGFPSVKKNRQAGVALCMHHLFSVGRRRIGLCVAQCDDFPRRERLEGYTRALAEVGLPYDPALVFSVPNTLSGGADLTAVVLRQHTAVDAMICGDYKIAIELIRGMETAGVKVPEQMAVVGFSGLESGAYNHVPLTTIDHSNQRMAWRAAQMLFERMQLPESEPGPPAETIVIPPKLVVRASCGAHLRTNAD